MGLLPDAMLLAFPKSPIIQVRFAAGLVWDKMNVEQPDVSEVFKGLVFSEEEISDLASKLQRIHLKKGKTLVMAGQTVTHQYYVCQGCLRTYFIDPQGKEHTLQFAVDDWWISDYTAFFNSGQAIMNMESIQDTLLYQLSRENMEALYVAMPKLETFIRKKMEKAFASFQKRILANLAHSAKERYVSFMHTYPSIEKNVKNYHIASYLGITTESLSRIRKELMHN